MAVYKKIKRFCASYPYPRKTLHYLWISMHNLNVWFVYFFFQFGLYAACFGGVMYIIFGSVRQITIGPASVIALLTSNYINPLLPSTAVILCFVSGIVELVCGLLRLGGPNIWIVLNNIIGESRVLCWTALDVLEFPRKPF